MPRFARRLGQRGRGLRLEHVALQRFLLLQQRLIGLAGVAQLIGALGGVGRQPQRDAQTAPSDPMTRTTNGTLATRVRGFRSIDASLTMIRSRSGGRTTLGALALRALARALAWLAFFGRAGPSVGRGIGLVCGAERCGRCSRVGLRRAAARRPAAALAVAARCAARSSLRRAPVLSA